MTTGEMLRVRAAMKPIATVPRALRTVDVATGEEAVAHHQRSDVCAVPAAGIVAEAMVALVLADAVLRSSAATRSRRPGATPVLPRHPAATDEPDIPSPGGPDRADGSRQDHRRRPARRDLGVRPARHRRRHRAGRGPHRRRTSSSTTARRGSARSSRPRSPPRSTAARRRPGPRRRRACSTRRPASGSPATGDLPPGRAQRRRQAGRPRQHPAAAAAATSAARIKPLLDERAPLYEKVATVIVDTDGRTPEEVAAEIVRHAEEEPDD